MPGLAALPRNAASVLCMVDQASYACGAGSGTQPSYLCHVAVVTTSGNEDSYPGATGGKASLRLTHISQIRQDKELYHSPLADKCTFCRSGLVFTEFYIR